jgi:hypothetical protein
MNDLPTAVRRAVGELRAVADQFDGLLDIIAIDDGLPDIVEIDSAPLAKAKSEYARRRSRRRCFPTDIFGEPAWDMMLDLFIAGGEGKLVSVSSLCLASDVPPTTALRWISILEREAILARDPDARDGRRVHLSLTAEATAGMLKYFRG